MDLGKTICSRIFSSLQDLFEENNIDDGHGIYHALKVFNHVENALAISTEPKNKEQRQAIKYAAILHDADDKKFFPQSKNNKNAREILENIIPEKKNVIDLTIDMIKLVGCSENGNSKVENGKEWMLIPRLCDRLEAMGEIGILRAWIYTKYINRPLFLPTTPRAKTIEELSNIVTPERFSSYLSGKKSESMIDHFYDKILHIGKQEELGINNSYIKNETQKRHKETVNFILEFGKTGKIDIRKINKIRVKNSQLNK